MPYYRFEVRHNSGPVQAGTLSAASMAEAGEMLRRQGGHILALGPAAARQGRKLSVHMPFNGPTLRDVLNFTNQLAVMVKAGISIRAAIEAIAEQCANVRFKEILEAIRRDVESGKQLSDALVRYPKVFSPLYVNMVRASELSGSFAGMLEKIVAYLNQQIETRTMVRSAMVYPAIIAGMAVFTTVFLLTYVLPRFVAIFEGKEAALPLPTKVLMGLSAFMVNYWYLVVGGLGAATWGFMLAIRTRGGRMWWDAAKMRIPLFRRMFRALYISRGLHTMGVLINAGVPMLDVLTITAQVSGNVHYYLMWVQVANSVKQGKKIAAPLGHSKLMPRSVVQMIASGEESGRLGEVLDNVSQFYANELKAVIKNVTAMIEPLMIVAMGMVVGFIAMSIVLPIFKLSSLVK